MQCAVEIGRTKSRATYPTPTVCGNNNNDITGYGMGLATFIKVIKGVECRQMFATQQKNDARHGMNENRGGASNHVD